MPRRAALRQGLTSTRPPSLAQQPPWRTTARARGRTHPPWVPFGRQNRHCNRATAQQPRRVVLVIERPAAGEGPEGLDGRNGDVPTHSSKYLGRALPPSGRPTAPKPAARRTTGPTARLQPGGIATPDDMLLAEAVARGHGRSEKRPHRAQRMRAKEAQPPTRTTQPGSTRGTVCACAYAARSQPCGPAAGPRLAVAATLMPSRPCGRPRGQVLKGPARHGCLIEHA